ncbi:PKD domain-containing protein [Ilyomonas limi]|uniref:PKD domain-containing protein n=1 Tax=Ilyomonas limi TaxID=2575867 RepID=UPI0014851163|nr:PKD domain-containing protein [Ilyomonas limi]
MKKPIHFLQLCTVVLLSLFAVSAKAQPHAAFSSDVIQGCSPLVVQFTDNSTGDPTEWLWDLGNGTKSTNQSPSAVFLNAGTGTITYTIKLVVKNSIGADSVVKERYISVYSNPQVAFTSDITQGCPPFIAHFTDQSKNGSGTVTSWLWDFGEGTVSTEQNPSHTYSLPNIYTVSLTATNSEGCKQTYTWEKYIQVADTVNADFDYKYTNICQSPAPIAFTNRSSSATPLSSFNWTFGDGQTSSDSAPSHTYNNIGTYKVQLVAVNNSGCKDTIIKSLTIGKAGADFTYNTSTACTNSAVAFTNTSSTIPASVSWDFGDGTTSTIISPNHIYKNAGKYTVTMRADFGSCVSSIKKDITIQNRPSVAFDVSKTDICQLPYKVQFTNRSTDAVTYKWTFGDGQTDAAINPEHAYTAAGFFDVKLVASSANGCADSITQKQAVRVGPPVINSLGGNLPVSGCVPQAINPKPNITSAEPIVKYKWNFGDGTTSEEANPTHVYNKEGVFAVQLIVFTASGCSDTLTLEKAVIAVMSPVAGFSASPLDVCAKSAVTFTDSSRGTVTDWSWQFGDGSTSTLPNPVHKYGDTGYFKVTLVVSNNQCRDTITKEKYVHIRPPVAAFYYKIDCAEPYKRTFKETSKGALSWQWDFGDGTSTTTPSPLHNYSTTGTYNVQLIVKNEQCSDTAKQVLRIVDEHPTFSYAMAGEAACRNDAVNFAAANFNGESISSFSWNFGDSTPVNTSSNPTPTHQYAAAGNFAPQLITTDVLGCKDTIDNKVAIKVFGAKAGFSNLAGICINSTAAFTDTSKSDGAHPITKWEWSYGDGKTSSYTTAPFNHLYDTAGYFNVKLTVYDSYGCKDSVVKTKAIQVTNPVADFTSAAPVKCVGNNISFVNKAVGESLVYSWNFGDNTAASSDASPVHTYKNEGLYGVKLNVTDKYGCKAEMDKQNFVTISNPKAAFKMNGPTEGTCPPLIVKPTNASTSFTSVSWIFGDGAIAAMANPTHIYTQGGNFEMKLIAKGYGECYDTATQLIKLKGPSGSFSYDILKGCNPTTVTFNAITKNATKVIWDYSDGNVDEGMESTKKHTYNEYGQYIPKLVITDNAGCQVGIENPDTIYISGIKPAYLFSTQTACDSSMAGFADASTPYWDKVKSYQWSFGDGTVSDDKNPIHYYKVSGKYRTTLTVNTAFGCTDSLSQMVDVTVHTSPVASITAPDSLCVATLATLKANDAAKAPTTTWQWALNKSTSIGTAQNALYQFNEPGAFVLSSVATTSFGCTDTATHRLFVVAAPNINAGIDTFVCKGGATLLSATGANKYHWSSQSNLSCANCASTMVSPSEASQYIVTGNNGFGCLASDTVNVRVIEPVNVIAQNDTLCLGENATLQVSGAKLYNWSPAVFLSDATSGAPVFKAAKDTTITYTVTGTDEKKCFADTKNVTVKVYPIPHIEIADKQIDLNVGSSVQLMMKSSADITQWRWSPSTFLSDASAQNPIATPKQSITYTCVASNNGSCFARDQISINVMCNQANMFVPNTFSPNGDGINDHFFPRGQGVFNIKSLRVFNRWGQVVFEKNNFLPNVENDGWDGTFKGQPLASDVYVYMIEITCDNNAVVPFKGNVTLLR